MKGIPRTHGKEHTELHDEIHLHIVAVGSKTSSNEMSASLQYQEETRQHLPGNNDIVEHVGRILVVAIKDNWFMMHTRDNITRRSNLHSPDCISLSQSLRLDSARDMATA
jgi:hypothetical protein